LKRRAIYHHRRPEATKYRIKSRFQFVSRDHYTLVYFGAGTKSHEAICDLSIARLAERLDPVEFQRLHRNGVARKSAIVALSRSGRGELMVELSNGMKLPVSRSHRKILRKTLRNAADDE